MGDINIDATGKCSGECKNCPPVCELGNTEIMKSEQKYPLNIESIDLEITSRCNLRCPYCYVGTGKFPMGDMSDETIEQVFDLIDLYGHPVPTVGRDKNGKQFKIQATQISFYGGEPMLVFDRIKYFIIRSYERGMKLRFTALSNGTLGTKEQVNFLNSLDIWTQRSIDGHPDVQEKCRPCSIKAYEEQNKIWKDYNHSRRMTVMPEAAKDLMKSFKYFEEQGYRVGMSPMPNYYTDWTEEQIEDFKKSLWELGEYYVERWLKDKNDAFYIYYFANEIRGRFQNSQKFGCGGSKGLHCISWDGYMYMCHRFSKDSHDSEVCFGHIKEVLAGTAKGYGVNLMKQTSKFKINKKEDWLEECKTCYAQLGCEKGCVHTNYECTKTYDTPPKLYCELRKTAKKVVDWIDDQLREKDRDWWKRGSTLSTKKNAVQGCQINCGVN
jgi:uncharacterized protein